MTAQCRECQRLVLLTDCEQCGARICGACWARHFERHTGASAIRRVARLGFRRLAAAADGEDRGTTGLEGLWCTGK